jgi:hypothetical protein
MLKGIIHYRFVLIIAGMLTAGFLFVTCMGPGKEDNTQPLAYAGSAACADCHRDIYRSHIQTAHYLTSQPSTEKNVRISADPAENKFYYNPDLYIAVEKRKDSFYQVEYADGVEKQEASIDITVGSGKRGQTFLYWYHDKLLQMPLTWYTAYHRWTNSPGFSNRVIFRRPATSRCLECHTTFVQKTSKEGVEPEDFSGAGIVFGVDCEKCHGPAARHVAFHQQNPGEKNPHFIISPKDFTRSQNLDLCKLCHGGRLTKTKPSFSFRSGDNLRDYFQIDTAAKSVADIDVHGNQYGMLAASKCFKNSQMTCLTCHSPHDNETGKKELFSQRCMTCHTEQHGNFCPQKTRIGPSITKNCIDCHMPEQTSRSIMFLLQGQTVPTPASMRSHFIAIYPEETKRFFQKNSEIR